MEYSLEQLKRINLYSLRVIARDIGVRAPTALTKIKLIDEIIKIQSGEKEPTVPNKRGRPAGKCVVGVQVISNPEERMEILKIKQQAKQELINDILAQVKEKLEQLL